MMKIGKRKRAAGGTVAPGIDGAEIVTETSIANVHPAATREQSAITSETSLQNAIEHVDAVAHGFEEILRRSNTHDIARLLRGERFGGDRHHLVEQGFRLSHGEPSDAVARKVERRQLFSAFAPEMGVHATLHNAEESLVGAGMGTPGPLRPPGGALE